MLVYLVLKSVAVLTALPITALLLRHARRTVRRELARRIAEGDVVAGVPATC